MSSSRPGNRTLQRSLVIRITVIVTVVAIALGAVSILLVRQILTGNLDQQLRYAVHATDEHPHGPGMGNSPAGRTDDLRLGGLPTGSIWLIRSSTGVIRASVIWDVGSGDVPSGQIEALLALPTDSTVRTIQLDDLGAYRAVAVESGGALAAVAAPLDVNQAVIGRMLAIELGLIVAAGLAAAAASSVLVRQSLRPLTRLAQTAGQVAALPLESGEPNLAVRVPPREADASTEVGSVGVAFNAMLDHVESSLQARHASESRVRQFVADASHELRNPLAAIRGYAELTRRDRDELPADTVFALGRIESESQRMSRLVEQMLLLARLDGAPDLSRSDVDLSEITMNAVSDARAASPAHRWLVRLPDEPVIISADANQLQQSLANLLGNARKHTPAGSTVQTTVEARDGWARLIVSDDGPGIAPELVDHIFERFTRADAARAHDGEGSTGLGLAIVAAIAKAHGGQVAAESRPATASEPGHTRFTLSLPLRGAAAETPPQVRDVGHTP